MYHFYWGRARGLDTDGTRDSNLRAGNRGGNYGTLSFSSAERLRRSPVRLVDQRVRMISGNTCWGEEAERGGRGGG